MRNTAQWSAFAHWGAPPSPENAAVAQDFSNIPNLFPPAKLQKKNPRVPACGECGAVKSLQCAFLV